MLTLLPQGVCSRDYRVTGDVQADLNFDWLGANGSIEWGDRVYQVRKTSWLASEWTLALNGAVCAEAKKAGFLSSSFDIRAGELHVVLRSKFFSRQFTLEIGARIVGTIAPMHAFTRRATVTCTQEVPVLVQMFAFWIVRQIWAARDSSAAAT